MKQSKHKAFFGERFSVTDTQNIQDERNLSDSVDLLDNNGEVPSKENEVIVIDEVSTNIIGKCADEGGVDVLSDIIINHDYDIPSKKETQAAKQTTAKAKPLEKDIRRYLPSWEKQSVCFYKTYVYDIHNIMHEKNMLVI